MTLKALAASLLLAAVSATGAQAANWIMDPGTSTVSFTGTQTGREFTGQFRRFTTNIVLDTADLSTASIEAAIDITSFASGSPDRDSDSQNRSWFYTEMFPQAVFTSREVRQTADGSYVAVGTLEVKGVARDVELPFTLSIDNDRATADGSILLRRLDYNVGDMDEDVEEELVGHEVTVTLHIEASKAE